MGSASASCARRQPAVEPAAVPGWVGRAAEPSIRRRCREGRMSRWAACSAALAATPFPALLETAHEAGALATLLLRRRLHGAVTLDDASRPGAATTRTMR